VEPGRTLATLLPFARGAPAAASTPAGVDRVTAYGIGRLPLGVAIIAVLVGIFGFFVLLAGLLIALVGIGFGLATGTTVFGATGAVAGLILFVIGAIILAVAFGLWDQELWALVIAIIALLFFAIAEFSSGAWLGLVVSVLLIAYLVAVSSHFD
jgi:hypothetical protein